MNISKKFSKKLAENGCKLESKAHWVHVSFEGSRKKEWEIIYDEIDTDYYKDKYFPAYDILNDICLEYKQEFFGDKDVYFPGKFEESPFSVPLVIQYLSQNEIEKAEDYIWENCKFNPKNKKL